MHRGTKIRARDNQNVTMHNRNGRIKRDEYSRSCKRRLNALLVPSLARSLVLIMSTIPVFLYFYLASKSISPNKMYEDLEKLMLHRMSHYISVANPDMPVVSVVILTYRKYDALAKLLPSVLVQETPFNFEIIIADNGCLHETEQVISNAFASNRTTIPHTYLPLCDNRGYAKGNNAAVQMAAFSSQMILFLNDDIVLDDPHFLNHMVQLINMKRDAAAIGCKIANADKSQLIEAGSMVFADGNGGGFGAASTDIYAPLFSYAKPVDYVSGACILVDKFVFEDYGGFDGERFPNYYEDTDLQMHIQHDLGKEVWLQPLAVARHEEHGSFGQEGSRALIQEGRKTFSVKWFSALWNYHLPLPWEKRYKMKHKLLFHAADLRARNPLNANILYVDDAAPIESELSGFGRRAFDNLSNLAGLGYRVTLATFHGDLKNRCNESCREDLSYIGIEYVSDGANEVIEARAGYYDVVVLSGQKLSMIEKFIMLKKWHSFSLIVDCYALGFRRDDDMLRKSDIYLERMAGDVSNEKARSIIAMADLVITGSEAEAEIVTGVLPPTKAVVTIGHDIDFERTSSRSFDQRYGILFIGSFVDGLYYNGDAILHFLKEIYPIVLSRLPASESPIPVTIAGCGIHTELRNSVAKLNLDSSVTFVECPSSFDNLFEVHRIFIAPYLHDAGVPYTVSHIPFPQSEP